MTFRSFMQGWGFDEELLESAEVDGQPLYPGELYMHSRDEPYPRGFLYSLVLRDPVLISMVRDQYSCGRHGPLTRSQASSAFLGLSYLISAKYGREHIRFWANTIDELVVSENEVVMRGLCSPHWGSSGRKSE